MMMERHDLLALCLREMRKPMTVEHAMTTVWRMEWTILGYRVPIYWGDILIGNI
jgi:hypothetical protein